MVLRYVDRFQQRIPNLDLTIYDKQAGVGGTWYANRYPGLACDIPSHCVSGPIMRCRLRLLSLVRRSLTSRFSDFLQYQLTFEENVSSSSTVLQDDLSSHLNLTH